MRLTLFGESGVKVVFHKGISDSEIFAEMLDSVDIVDWNRNREAVKRLRSVEWVSQHIDASGLIGKTKIKGETVYPCV